MSNSTEVSQVVAQGCRNDLLNYGLVMEDKFDINWHHELIADRLQQVYKGLGTKDGLKRLMIAMPPQIANKSTLASKLFPSWALGKNPNLNIIVGSYNATMAKTHSKKAMNLARDPKYEAIFGTRLNPRKRSAEYWGVIGGRDGGYRAFGMKTGITGNPADLCIIDDPIKGREDANSKIMRDKVWDIFTEEVMTRLLPGIGALILIFTRWHLDDPVGRIERELAEQGKKLEDEWEVLHLPAIAEKDEEWTLSDGRKVGRKKGESIWEDRFPADPVLKKIKMNTPATTWAALYQQSPISKETQVFKPEMFQHIEEDVVATKDTVRFLAIDTSSGAGDDYTGFADVRVDRHTGHWYVVAWHEKLTPLELIDKLFHLRQVNRYTRIGMESTMYQKVIEPFLKQEMLRRNEPFYIDELKNKNVSKDLRIFGLEPLYSAGKIFHIKGKCDTLEEELELYGSAPNDDVADALAYIPEMVKEFNTHQNQELEAAVADVPSYE